MAPTSIRKASKPSGVVKLKKKRRTTESNRNHRFQSFSERISNLKIDPVRRRRNVEAQPDVSGGTTTYFGTSLEEWQDRNMSATFTQFAKEVGNYCDSLPVLLHNDDKIMDLLDTYIAKEDAIAMEPLLNLLSHFAHDLDARFEKHFSRAVQRVAAVAAKHSDLGVVEGSFTCLAWLFKYLSRLLTPDLRPLYDLMAPYMGKEKQKPYIVRFAAESMSFLIRKAAVVYERDTGPLDLIITHMLQDCLGGEAQPISDLLPQGIMTLLTDGIQGVQNGLHQAGIPILKSLFKHDQQPSEANAKLMSSMIAGTLTSLVHHCTTETFQPVLEVVLAHIEQTSSTTTCGEISSRAKMLFTIVSVRKGSRIREWKPLMRAVRRLLEMASALDELTDEVAFDLLGLLAIAMQTATIDAVLTSRDLLDTVRTQKWSPFFLSFCDLFARLGMDRFDDFVFPHFQKFVLGTTDRPTEQLLILIPRLTQGHSSAKLKGDKHIPAAVSKDIESVLRAGDGSHVDDNDLARLNAELASLSSFAIGEQHNNDIEKLLLQLIQDCLATENDVVDTLSDFALGAGLEYLLDADTEASTLAPLWLQLCEASPRFVALPKFWSNTVRFMKKYRPAVLQGHSLETLESSLIRCLSLSSHSIRQDSLDTWLILYELRGIDVPDILSTAAAIESIPISLETTRTLSSNIRKLAQDYQKLGSGDLMLKVVPNYCFGLLYLRLSSAWEDVSSAVATMISSKPSEDVVMGLVETWLQSMAEAVPKERSTSNILDIDSDGFRVFSDFECPNLAKISAICAQVFQGAMGGLPSLSQNLASNQRRTPFVTLESRSQALRVLRKIPSVAEKRSRILVPVLLSWAGTAAEDGANDGTEGDRWTRKDQKAMLAIVAQFTNPKVLYRSADVYEALLNLCANGDIEIQQSALKAILAWKDPAVTRYAENLNIMLDEARFREQLSVFLRNDDDGRGIRAEDQASLMCVLLRLLYGRVVAGRKDGQTGRRKAIFVSLSRFGQETLGDFLGIALSAVKSLEVVQKHWTSQLSSDIAKIPLRRQMGMLNMINDMLQVLGAELAPFTTRMLNAVLICTINASHRIGQSSRTVSPTDEPDAETIETLPDTTEPSDTSLLRSVRQRGVQCLVQVFAKIEAFESADYQRLIAEHLIVPRLMSFAEENAQSISGSLRLFAAWTLSNTRAQIFLEPGTGTEMLHAIAQLLRLPHTTDAVRSFILENIFNSLASDEIDSAILQPCVSDFVRSIGHVIESQPSKDVLDASVKSFSLLADRISNADEAADVLRICSKLIKLPSKVVSPWAKLGLLRTMKPLLARFEPQGAEKAELFQALSALYSRLREAEMRTTLSETLSTLVHDDESLMAVVNICTDLNAAGSRLDEPDLESRERAFAAINEKSSGFTAIQWLPIVHNCLFFLSDPDDRVNRLSASHALRQFIEAVILTDKGFTALVEEVWSHLERAMRDSSELVRAESLAVLGHVIEQLPDWGKAKSLTSLSIGGDDEASIFTNVLHIQQHRRLRALRRLSDSSDDLDSTSIIKLFLPLLEHFVFDPIEGDAGRTLTDQTIVTIGSLAGALTWSSWRATFQRYTGYLKSKVDMEKTILRLLGALVDSGLKNAKPKNITSEQLPPLVEYLHQKDESTVDRRMPVAITITKLLMALPQDELTARLPAILLDVCYVLKSRSQEARDQARRALATIASLIGAQYFKFILRTLRTVLDRGYQLHVLSFTVHSLLVHGSYGNGDLDECLTDLMGVIESDVFGATGQEKEAEEYKSIMKEVKSSKSYDTLELLARLTTIPRLVELVRPLEAVLSMKLESKTVKKCDDLLTRLRKGLDQNPAAESRDMLSFCWQVVNQVHLQASAVAKPESQPDERRKRYIVQPEEQKRSRTGGVTTSYGFKLVTFALDLVRKIVRRHDDLQTPQNMAGFLPIIGDSLLQGQEEVKVAAIKLLSTVMRIDMPQLRENAPLYVREAVALISASPSMTTETAKCSLELITVTLREKSTVTIREKDLAVLLKRLTTDIDEPDRQGIIYRFLRAVLIRKIVITEVYEVMDAVGQTMITNPDRSIRESARGAYEHFVMEYPQGKDRWQKQTAFLTSNLQYEHAAGRQSIMEFLHRILGKIGDDVFEEICPRIFISLLPVLVSDSDTACREFAGILTGKLFERASEKQLIQFQSMMGTWLKKDKKSTTKTGSLQCWSRLLSVRSLPRKQLENLCEQIEELLLDLSDEENELSEPALAIEALKTFATMVEKNSIVVFDRSSASLWEVIQKLPVQSDFQLQEQVAQLLGALFHDLASASSKSEAGLNSLPLRGSGGIELQVEDLRRLCAANLRTLRAMSLETRESLLSLISRNVVFLGRCFAANKMLWKDDDFEHNSDNDDEDAEQDVPRPNRTALTYLIIRLSSIIQQDKWSVVARTAALQCQSALIHQLEEIPEIQLILRPLFALTDPSVPQPPGELHRALTDKAHELLEQIQKKVGSETFIPALAATRAQAKIRRDERRQKRRIEAVSAPERWAKEKKRKHERMKLKKKVKGEEARGRRRGW